MPQKKKKIAGPMRDGCIQASHIHAAQAMMVETGPLKLLEQVNQTEPNIVGFIGSVSGDIAAHVRMDSDLPRAAAHRLRERIIALALDVYHAQKSAVYDLYKDLESGNSAGRQEGDTELPDSEASSNGGTSES